jgi:type IV pilus assembly protein PilQ
MDSRVSAGFLWRAPLLVLAALVLGACATEMAEAQLTPAAPQVAAPVPTAPTPAPPAAPVTPVPIEVTGIEVQEAGPGGLIVVVAADGPIATYESFTLPDPPRLVLDIPNATHAVPQPISTRPPLVTTIRSSQYRERPVKVVRVVLDLRSVLPYRVGTADSQLRVQLGTAVGATPPSPATAGPTPVSGAFGKVTRVDVQSVRGRQRIVIGTTGRVTYKVTEVSDPPSLLVDISGARIDPANARTLDLRQVRSPLNRLQASQQTTDPESVVRVVAELRSPARYEVRQTASAILVELLGSAPRLADPVALAASPSSPPLPAPMLASATFTSSAAAPVPLTAAPPAAGRLSMDFRDADINNLLRIIAEVSGRNVVAGSDVTGKVTVRLVNVEWEQALDVILKINNMDYEMDGNIIRVAPRAKLAAEKKEKEDQRVAAARARETERRVQIQVEPLVTKVVSVNYAKASDVLKNLDRLKTPGRADASIVVDDRTNSLIIQETVDSIAKMETLLRRLDVPTPQVLIEARIVEAFRGFAQSLGVEYGFLSRFQANGGQATRGPISMFSSIPGTNLTVPAPGEGIPLSISFPASGQSASGLGMIFGSLEGGSILGIRLSAAESEQKIKTLSTPKVATMDNQEAEIRQGTQVPYTTVDSSGRTVVAFQDAFIRLKVTPHITNDRRISMKVEAEKTAPGTRIDYAGGFAFPLEQRKATTNVLVSNGSTIVIGGLFQSSDSESESRLPWLHRIPLLGMMFKSHSIGPNEKRELLIFLTPTILEEPRLS